MLNLNSIMIGTTNLEEMATFYEKVFGRKADMVDGDFHGWKSGGCFLSVGNHSQMTGKNQQGGRVMMVMETSDVKAEFDRIKADSGAEVVKEPYQMEGWDGWIATFADPDGNYFQLMTPWES
jgi:predicted enzyme related to lactoylglutathione lyase